MTPMTFEEIVRAYNQLHEQLLITLRGNDELSAMYVALHTKHLALQEAHLKEVADLKAENSALKAERKKLKSENT